MLHEKRLDDFASKLRRLHKLEEEEVIAQQKRERARSRGSQGKGSPPMTPKTPYTARNASGKKHSSAEGGGGGDAVNMTMTASYAGLVPVDHSEDASGNNYQALTIDVDVGVDAEVKEKEQEHEGAQNSAGAPTSAPTSIALSQVLKEGGGNSRQASRGRKRSVSLATNNLEQWKKICFDAFFAYRDICLYRGAFALELHSFNKKAKWMFGFVQKPFARQSFHFAHSRHSLCVCSDGSLLFNGRFKPKVLSGGSGNIAGGGLGGADAGSAGGKRREGESREEQRRRGDKEVYAHSLAAKRKKKVFADSTLEVQRLEESVVITIVVDIVLGALLVSTDGGPLATVFGRGADCWTEADRDAQSALLKSQALVPTLAVLGPQADKPNEDGHGQRSGQGQGHRGGPARRGISGEKEVLVNPFMEYKVTRADPASQGGPMGGSDGTDMGGDDGGSQEEAGDSVVSDTGLPLKHRASQAEAAPLGGGGGPGPSQNQQSPRQQQSNGLAGPPEDDTASAEEAYAAQQRAERQRAWAEQKEQERREQLLLRVRKKAQTYIQPRDKVEKVAEQHTVFPFLRPMVAVNFGTAPLSYPIAKEAGADAMDYVMQPRDESFYSAFDARTYTLHPPPPPLGYRGRASDKGFGGEDDEDVEHDGEDGADAVGMPVNDPALYDQTDYSSLLETFAASPNRSLLEEKKTMAARQLTEAAIKIDNARFAKQLDDEVEAPVEFSQFPPTSVRMMQAVLVLQRAIRRFLFRIKRRRAAFDRNSKIILIQYVFRRMIRRKKRKLYHSALVIQRLWRGYHTRKTTNLYRLYNVRPAVAEHKVVILQCAVRMYLAKKEVRRRAIVLQVAGLHLHAQCRVIQRLWRNRRQQLWDVQETRLKRQRQLTRLVAVEEETHIGGPYALELRQLEADMAKVQRLAYRKPEVGAQGLFEKNVTHLRVHCFLRLVRLQHVILTRVKIGEVDAVARKQIVKTREDAIERRKQVKAVGIIKRYLLAFRARLEVKRRQEQVNAQAKTVVLALRQNALQSRIDEKFSERPTLAKQFKHLFMLLDSAPVGPPTDPPPKV